MLEEHRDAAPGRSGPPAGRVVLAGVGADAHSVGLTVLREALARGGFDVDFLGVQQDLTTILRAAGHTDAVLISNMDGHAKYYLADLRAARREAGLDGQLWYLGGYPALDDRAADLDDLGFDRVFQGYVSADTVLHRLRDDLAGRPRKRARRARRSAPIETPVVLPLSESDRREDVLPAWRTGAAALDRAANADRLRARTSLADRQREAKARREILVQPRTGVSSVEGQEALFSALRRHGADVLSFQIDSLTRNNQYEDIERILKAAADLPPEASQLNGYPAVNLGLEAMARLSAMFGDTPFQVRHSTRDPRLLAELTFGAGIAAYEGGALSYNLPYFRDYPIAHAIRRWRYVDRLAGRYHAEFGVTIDREFFGVLTACLVPPCVAAAVNVFEALLAAQCGVKSVTLGYAEQGCRAQDVGAVRAIQRLGEEYLARLGLRDVEVSVVWHQFMGAFPRSEDKARQILRGSAESAVLSGAVRLMLKTHAEAVRIPSLDDNRESLTLVRDLCRARRTETADDQVRFEEELVVAETRAIVDSALAAADHDIGRAVVLAVERGWVDVPFSPSRWNAGSALPLRDCGEAVRFAETGLLPFPEDVKAFHRAAVAARLRRDGDDVVALLERDLSATARGEFDDWPLA
ncbi:cobalamin-dependent protein [Embleya hyalina]|uniref:Methylaspartate mutase n=1 Tax=Embleya hyalina TaxID=516124 RepID=A0A401Z1Y4_9ACTN|nr:cobalamin-dependent protein [Embleya hyalina]GCE00796.1 methylaspartate mutase [Embleya hyalina]